MGAPGVKQGAETQGAATSIHLASALIWSASAGGRLAGHLATVAFRVRTVHINRNGLWSCVIGAPPGGDTPQSISPSG